jgi:TolA-binding protein
MDMMRSLRLLAIAAILAPALLGAQGAEPRLVAATRADDPARDAAIDKLENFLGRYPDSPLRPAALLQLGELLVRRADEEYAEAQRSGREGLERPNYGAAIARYQEIVTRYPTFERVDAAAYTLGTLYFASQRFADAARMFELVVAREGSTFRPEAYFRLGDAYFELAARERGEPRRTMFARAAQAYENATTSARRDGDIYFLSLYKLGWSYYNQANQTNQQEYRQAVEVFGRLVSEYDKLTPEQQNRLGLRTEAIDYMAVAFTQVGGAVAASQYFQSRAESSQFKLPLLRRVAANLRDQGDLPKAVEAYQAVIAEAPADAGALEAQRAVVDIYQNRMIEPEQAQQARIALVQNFGPGSAWWNANEALHDSAQTAREAALREAGQYSLARAQRGERARYAEAADLYGRYLTEFAASDSAQAVSLYHGEALFGQGNYLQAGTEFSRAAFGYPNADPKRAQTAGQNAIVALDSAVSRNKTDRAAQDSLFAVVDKYVAAFPETDVAKRALVQKGRRASEAERWDVMAATFRTYVEKYPNDRYTPEAQRLIGDALYKQGQFAEAQVQWDLAQTVASRAGRRALADSIGMIRTAAADAFADTLVKRGEYRRAAEEVYVAFADRNPSSSRAPDALRNAIEAYVLADSAARARGDQDASRQAKERAIELSARLVSQYATYRYNIQYQNLRGQFLSDLGRRDEAVTVYQQLIRDNPRWEGRADAMVRVAVMLDSLDKGREAAQAYERFSAAYPRDARAADAQYNAAVTYVEAGDTTSSAKAYATFATRFPRDSRVPQAQQARVTLLKASGDLATANAELARLCARPTEAVRAACAERTAEQAFRQGAALFPRYKNMRLVIATPAQLTRTGVERASAQKRALLQTMTNHFTRAIETGSPEWLAAASYYVGLAQWEYGEFLKNVRLPQSLTAEQRAAAQQGAAQQAEQYYTAARQTWQTLLDKAQQENLSNPWIDRARAAIGGEIPATPPTSSTSPAGATVGGGS